MAQGYKVRPVFEGGPFAGVGLDFVGPIDSVETAEALIRVYADENPETCSDGVHAEVLPITNEEDLWDIAPVFAAPVSVEGLESIGL